MLVRTSLVLVPFILGLYASSRLGYLDVVSIEEAPFLALVLFNNSKYFCTGSLLQESWVLTAAHCLFDADGYVTEDETSVFVVTGTSGIHKAKQDIERGVAQIRQSAQLVVDDRYHFSENFLSDLVLIKLQSPFNMTKYTQVAPLDPKYYGQNGNEYKSFECFFYGFGKVYRKTYTEEDGTLKKQMINLDKACSCLDFIWSIQWNSATPKSVLICESNDASFITMSGMCSGDQGAPLICGNYLRGMGNAAFQYENREKCSARKGENECGSRDTMCVFTDLCPYSQWIARRVPGLTLVDENCQKYEHT